MSRGIIQFTLFCVIFYAPHKKAFTVLLNAVVLHIPKYKTIGGFDMKLRLTALFSALALLTVPFGMVGCTNSGKTVIRLNEVTHSIFYAPLYIAINNGYFDEENIELKLSNGGGADKVMTAVISGAADIGLLGPEATI